MAHLGLVFLDDLHSSAAWNPRLALRWLQDRPCGELLPPTAEPPPVLVVVARALARSSLEQSLRWLRQARRVILVLDRRDDVGPGEGLSADEHAELLRDERRELLAALPPRTEVLEVTGEGPAGDPADPALRAQLEHALALARPLAAALASRWPERARPAPVPPGAPGPWLPFAPLATHDTDEALHLLAPALCLADDGPVLLDAMAGERLALRTGARTPVAALRGVAGHGWTVAALPGARAWLRFDRKAQWWLEDGETSLGEPLRIGRPLGVAPSGELAWCGWRCRFSWHLLTSEGPAYFTPSSHDWPSGHAKKLYGFEDNHPRYVHLSADGEACLSVFDHDALVSSGVPLRWRASGDVMVAVPAAAEPRALLFERADDPDAFPADPFAADEDARDRYAATVLGPSAALRYVVAVEGPSYRLALGQVQQLQRLAPGAQWLVFDAEHRLVRGGTGRLLAGWDRWLLVEQHGRVEREDLLTGQRSPVPEDPSRATPSKIAAAVLVPGSGHAVLLSHDDGGWIRLV